MLDALCEMAQGFWSIRVNATPIKILPALLLVQSHGVNIGTVPSDNILELLIGERDRLNRAIEALQGSATGRGRAAKAGRRRVRSAAQNKAQSERMKAYWAKRRREKAKAVKQA